MSGLSQRQAHLSPFCLTGMLLTWQRRKASVASRRRILLSCGSSCLWGTKPSTHAAASEGTATSALHVLSALPRGLYSLVPLRNIPSAVATADLSLSYKLQVSQLRCETGIKWLTHSKSFLPPVRKTLLHFTLSVFPFLPGEQKYTCSQHVRKEQGRRGGQMQLLGFG